MLGDLSGPTTRSRFFYDKLVEQPCDDLLETIDKKIDSINRGADKITEEAMGDRNNMTGQGNGQTMRMRTHNQLRKPQHGWI